MEDSIKYINLSFLSTKAHTTLQGTLGRLLSFGHSTLINGVSLYSPALLTQTETQFFLLGKGGEEVLYRLTPDHHVSTGVEAWIPECGEQKGLHCIKFLGC